MSPVPLRPYQREALAAQKHRQLTVLPTGTGKTRIMAELAVQRPTLIVVHREELVDQTQRAIREIDPKARMGTVQGSRNDWQDITVAMQQTLRGQLRHLPALFLGPAPAQQILIDEAHRYTTEKSGHAILDAFEGAGATYGFTATPQIHGKPIYGPGMPWTGIAYKRSVVGMIREGYLCDVRGLTVRWGDLDLSKIKKTKGDYVAAQLGRAMARIHAPERIVEAWEEHAKDRKRTICFLPTVELGRATTRAFRERKHATLEVYGSTPKAFRRTAIDLFRRGECQVLVNVMVGAEGFDVPEVDCIVQARPTKSWTLYVQSVGRGLRTAPGKEDLLVLDVAGSAQEHDLASLPKCFELERFFQGKGKRKSVREATEGLGAREIELEQGRAAFDEMLLYTPVHWSTWGDERIAVTRDNGVVVIAPLENATGFEWGVFETVTSTGEEQELGIFDYPADAQEFAEDWIREHGDPKLYQRSRKWRRQPPTAKQVTFFKTGAVPTTRGEASEAITLAMYRRWRNCGPGNHA